ncbi:MAG: hypothetical protein JSR21_02495, partial [Proteobacteria bacterium]|nr:hypothetical protein [Pseudomonadota bacterium]
NTKSRFKAGLDRFAGFAQKAGRDPVSITTALRVLSGPGTRPRGSIEGEAEMFTGSDADWVGDIKTLEEMGVSCVDVRLFGYGAAQSLPGTLDAMKRFKDGVLDRL